VLSNPNALFAFGAFIEISRTCRAAVAPWPPEMVTGFVNIDDVPVASSVRCTARWFGSD
jgi:hypothetical protein